MKNPINCLFMKLGILFFVTLFFQTPFVPASEAGEMTPFYKSWLQEHSYVHPSLRPKTQPAPAKKMAQPKAMASAKTTTKKTGSGAFWKSWLQEHSYAHPGIGSSPAVAPAAKSLAKAAPTSAVKSSVAKTKSAPKFNICNFVCLSTCKTCKTSSNNYLMSRE